MNMKENSQKFLLGLDLGTSAIKGVAIDASGNVIAESSRETCFVVNKDGRFELIPEKHYQNVCGVIRELTTKVPGKIVALAMAAASGNTLLTDVDGKPLTNIISWMDQRAAQNPPKSLAGLTSEKVHQLAGWPCVNTFPLGHLAWLRENEAELYKSAGRYCMNTDWLLFRMTGKWLMDYSTATTSHLQKQTEFKYNQEFLDLLGIPQEKLSKLVPSSYFAGTLTGQALKDTGLSESMQVFTGCFDHPAAARALGVLKPGQLMLSCGTSWVGFSPENDRNKIIDLELLCDPFLAPNGGAWGAIFSVPYIGRTIDWYVDNLIAPGEKNKFRIFDELAEAAMPGAGGLKIDLRKPPVSVKGSRENISRAIMENAADLLNDKIKLLESRGIKFSSAVMVGGPSKSPVWPGIVEKITGIKLSVGSQHAGAKGAAILAGIGAGIYKNEYDALNN